MSEYQYYEFLAIDQRLTDDEIDELRSYSSRATITPSSFVNEYNWGDFKGDVDQWMEDYFDAFLYFANWGTRILKLRIPAMAIDEETLAEYAVSESFWFERHGEKLVLSFVAEEVDMDEWPEEQDALASLFTLREDLARGDFRALYLGWLLSQQGWEGEDEDLEPPVPPGLGELNGALSRFIDFLGIDLDLVEAAAAASPPRRAVELTDDAIREWVSRLPPIERDDYLARLIVDDEPMLAVQLQRQVAGEGETPAAERRTAQELRTAARTAATERERAIAERRARQREEAARKAAEERVRYLESLSGREPELWDTIENLIALTQPKHYDEAIRLLLDLRELSISRGTENQFLELLDDLQVRHSRKPSLLRRLNKAGLTAPFTGTLRLIH